MRVKAWFNVGSWERGLFLLGLMLGVALVGIGFHTGDGLLQTIAYYCGLMVMLMSAFSPLLADFVRYLRQPD